MEEREDEQEQGREVEEEVVPGYLEYGGQRGGVRVQYVANLGYGHHLVITGWSATRDHHWDVFFSPNITFSMF